MKDKQIDDHINHLRDEHNLKKLMDEAYER